MDPRISMAKPLMEYDLELLSEQYELKGLSTA